MSHSDTEPPPGVSAPSPPFDLDASRPSIPLLGTFSPFDKEKLDKEKANWNAWSWEVYLAMSLNRSYDYVTGDILAPDVVFEPRAYKNWLSNDRSACAYLSSAISDAERKALGDPPRSGAKAYWEKLKTRHSSDGPVAQVYLLKEAMNVVITSPSESITKALDGAADLVNRAYAMSSTDGLAKDTFLSIVALNILGKEHESIQFQLQDRMQQATDSTPFTFTQIRAFLEDKQHLMDANKRQTAGGNPLTPSSIALSAQRATAPICSNCEKTGHTHPYCISPGGGMEGKSIEDSKKKRRADKEAMRGRSKGSNDTATKSTTNPSQKIRIPYKDANGQALILEVDASAITATPTSTSTPSPFAGIASIHSDIMPGVADSLISSTDSLELEGWMATYDIKDLPEARLPSVPITSGDFAFSTMIQATVGFRMIDTIPFKIDSGASAPISPIREDFVSYRPITPHGVRGLGGMVVKAIGIGNIIIHQPHNCTFILRNALHIPDAGVRLISISSLWRYSQQKVRFDGPTCSITSDNLVVATGTLNPKSGLYDLDIPTSSEMSAEAYAVTASPTLETWHRRLGHTNYQCIQNMARMSMVKGLPLSLSTTTPSKCVSCVLGKQTRTPVPKKREEGRRATRRLEIVWIDIIGPENVISRTGNQYMLDIVDDYTSYVFSIPLKTKDQAYPMLQAWQLQVETETGEKVKMYSG